MTHELPNPQFEFVVEENKVYKIIPSRVARGRFLQVTGTGTVDILGSIHQPDSLDDEVMTSGQNDTDFTGFRTFKHLVPNYIKFVQNQAGSRVITLSGFYEPQEITF